MDNKIGAVHSDLCDKESDIFQYLFFNSKRFRREHASTIGITFAAAAEADTGMDRVRQSR
jgi:hypothetical protein